MNQPKLSIIVTSYNVEKYIRTCLDGIMSQTLQDIEVIIVDDGSTDSTQSIIKEYALRDSKIKVFLMPENTPGGVASAANIGLKAAQGEYIGFADGDDIYDPSMFEKMYSKAQFFQSELALCYFDEFNTDSYCKNNIYEKEKLIFGNDGVLDIVDPNQKTKLLTIHPAPWRKIYKKDFLEKNRISFHECDFFFEDHYFHWLVILNARKIAIVDEVLCYHRIGRQGQTIMSSDRALLGIFYQHDLIYSYLGVIKQLNNYKYALIRKLIDHILWLNSQLSLQHSREFYESVIKLLDRFSRYDIEIMLLNEELNANKMALIGSLLDRNFDSFNKMINENSKRFNNKNLSFIVKIRSGIKKLNNRLKSHLAPSRKDLQNVNNKIHEVEKLFQQGFVLNEKKISTIIKKEDQIMSLLENKIAEKSKVN